jgi:hypothetical protein
VVSLALQQNVQKACEPPFLPQDSRLMFGFILLSLPSLLPFPSLTCVARSCHPHPV